MSVEKLYNNLTEWWTGPLPEANLMQPPVALESHSTEGYSPLTHFITQIPTATCEFFKDPQWMGGLSELISGTSHVCSLIGSVAGEIVPWLTIFNLPYLQHAVLESIDHGQTFVTAVKTSQVADAFFFSSKAVGSMGAAFNDILKPFAGGAILLGYMKLQSVSLAFSFVFPIIILVLAVIGGTPQGWATARSGRELYRINEERGRLGHTLAHLETHLRYFQKTDQHTLDLMSEEERLKRQLEEKKIVSDCFTSVKHAEFLQARIDTLLHFNLSAPLQSIRERIEDLIPLIDAAEGLCEQVFDDKLSPFEKVDKAIFLSSKLLTQARADLNIRRTQAFVDLEQGYEELLEIRDTLSEEGKDISDTIALELQSKVINQTVNIVITAMTLITMVLFLFLDILRHSKDETVTLGISDSYNPGIITDSSNSLFIIMPMRLNDD